MRSFITTTLLLYLPRTLAYTPFQAPFTLGSYPQDFTILGPPLEAIHESQHAPTGLALDSSSNLYLTYPRNAESLPSNVVKATSFNTEEAWPNISIQNCKAGQDASTCFINVQNIILDGLGQLWVIDSGIPFGKKPTEEIPKGGAKIMAFDESSGEVLRTVVIPDELINEGGVNCNDLRINNTLGEGGYAFITDTTGSILTINLETSETRRHLFNTSVVLPDSKYVGSYNGELIYAWNGTKKSFINTGADGIALVSGKLFWTVLASRRFYEIDQTVITNPSLSDEEILGNVVFPSQCGSETAGLSADDNGRLYISASEQNALYYLDTLAGSNKTSHCSCETEVIESENYVIKTLARNALIQHADSMVVNAGFLYFCTNQLELSPGRQEGNLDGRRGPFRSYRVGIGEGREGA